MTSLLARTSNLISRALAAFAVALSVASCGGGGVSANISPIVDSAALTILPAGSLTSPVVMYSGLPTTFILSGGTGAYIIASSDQAVLQVSGGVTGRSVTLIPNPVVAETTVTLTVRDTGTAAPVSATVTVRPGTVNNNLTITPSPTQSASCNPALCSGGDAEVKVTISQGGIPLAARGVRFEVLSGSFSFITSAPGVVPELLSLSAVVATDETGVARARIRATALAPNQTALLQATDMSTGAFRQASFVIAQFTGNALAYFTLPSAITFTGPFADTCASSVSTDVSIYGGSPPYSISGGSSAFSVSAASVAASGGRFSVVLGSTPVCITDAPIGVTDATGRTISVTVSNQAGTGTAPTPVVAVSPTTLSLTCGTSASFVVTGGAATLSVSSNHPRVTFALATRTVTVTREASDAGFTPPYDATARITVTDGTTTAFATVTVPVSCP